MTKKLLLSMAAALMAVAMPFSVSAQTKIAVAAHRGFWNCENAGGAQNSIASLREAQNNGFWGSETDVHLTSDDVIVVNHDNSINGVPIHSSTYNELKSQKLANGECISTLDQYLDQCSKSSKTILVLEFKDQGSKERNELLVDKSVGLLKEKKLFKPGRVMFISFALASCERIASTAPKFTNQYLNGELSPDELKAKKINGLDYHYSVLYAHPEWVSRAHDLGMTVNVWTVDSPQDIGKCIALGVDCITTNEPLRVRGKLGDRELRK